MALGVEAAGVITEIGEGVSGFAVGDEVLTHAVPLREQGFWAERAIAAAAFVAPKPVSISWQDAAAFPVPALVAEQVLTDALQVRAGESLLVNGASSTTGGLIVQLAAAKALTVIATAGQSSAERVRGLGARPSSTTETPPGHRRPDDPAAAADSTPASTPRAVERVQPLRRLQMEAG
jgi:NADPH:quinone reductase-like Zn-dependent oxidoreductase